MIIIMEKIVMPLSMSAIVKENPVRYAQMLQGLQMKQPVMADHPSDPLSLEYQMSPERLQNKSHQQEQSRRAQGGLGGRRSCPG